MSRGQIMHGGVYNCTAILLCVPRMKALQGGSIVLLVLLPAMFIVWVISGRKKILRQVMHRVILFATNNNNLVEAMRINSSGNVIGDGKALYCMYHATSPQISILSKRWTEALIWYSARTKRSVTLGCERASWPAIIL